MIRTFLEFWPASMAGVEGAGAPVRALLPDIITHSATAVVLKTQLDQWSWGFRMLSRLPIGMVGGFD